jgi:hypothetical protein
MRWCGFIVVMLVGCPGNRPPPTEDEDRDALARARALLAKAAARLETAEATARARIARVDGSDGSVDAQMQFRQGWALICASVSRIPGGSDDAPLRARVDHLCKVALPLADLTEIDATIAAQHPTEGAEPYGCFTFAGNFEDDLGSVSSSDPANAALRPFLDRYRKRCPHTAENRFWQPFCDAKTDLAQCLHPPG